VALKAVLDTNAVLFLLGGQLVEALPEGQYFASVITEIELLSYPSLAVGEERQIRELLSEITLVELTEEVKEASITLRRKHRLRLPDAIIAATADTLNAELFTNDRGLHQVPSLRCRQLRLRGT